MFTLTIDTGNAAFEGDPRPEVARILHKLADALPSSAGARPGTWFLHNVNGNRVGTATLTED